MWPYKGSGACVFHDPESNIVCIQYNKSFTLKPKIKRYLKKVDTG